MQTEYNKVFVIGGHKNGSLSLHHYFLSLGMRSVHGQFWCNNPALIAANDCFSDHFAEFQDGVDKLDTLVRDYPDSRFIINFRDLNSYIKSLFKHLAINTELSEPFNFDDVDEDALIGRVQRTHNFHQAALRYFDEKRLRHNLLVINLCNGKNQKNKGMIDEFLGISDNLQELPHANHFEHVPAERQKIILNKHRSRLEYVLQHIGIPAEAYTDRLNIYYSGPFE